MQFADDLAKNLDNADRVYNGICGLIDEHIARNAIAAPVTPHYQPVWQPEQPATSLDPAAAGISTMIWTTGFRSDWSWVELPIFDGAGYPTHKRGVTSMDGVYVLGLALALYLGLRPLRRRRPRFGVHRQASRGAVE